MGGVCRRRRRGIHRLGRKSARGQRTRRDGVLQVPDIEGERKRLESRGVSFEGKTEEIPGIVKLATFRDPSGNRLQLCQVLMHS